ncbi:2OG-Fe dioxygenase family protein [Streptomyces sp. NPDC014006]|uniref:2OG-Fe dioxygenase family protein n=1 Tax=Streptomyces sp. NPDC014006 TaxID=3364870 RepID=UPI0036F7F95D
MHDSTFSDAIAEVLEIREQYVKDRSVFVEGARMVRILQTLGATDEDLEKIRLVSDHLAPDPTLPFRESKNGRFCFDFDHSTVYRLESQPFALSAEEDFVRHDSGQTRIFEEIGNDLQGNSAFRALLAFKSMIFREVPTAPRAKLDYDNPSWICTVFNLRTVSTPDLVGEPALEGVHSDGVDHTMTTFLGSENMTDDSAVTFLHDMRERNATRWNETDPELVLGQCRHRHFLDTLIVVDHERKHSLSPVSAVDKRLPATRDMLIFFTRKPVLEGHISHPYDSLKVHERLPMAIGLPSPVARRELVGAGSPVAGGTAPWT